jgi:hypothetical protein
MMNKITLNIKYKKEITLVKVSALIICFLFTGFSTIIHSETQGNLNILVPTKNIESEPSPSSKQKISPSISFEKTVTISQTTQTITVASFNTTQYIATSFFLANLNTSFLKLPSYGLFPQSIEPNFEYYNETNPDYFLLPKKPKNKYPDLAIDGFYECKISGRNYNPKQPTWNVWNAIRRDPIYNKIPRDVLVGDPKFDMRYYISIEGKLSKDLSVHYDIEQEPDFPGKYDIQVKHKDTKLTFHHFDATFQNGDFVNVKKALNGVKLESKGENWDAIITTGKQRSDPKKYESNGNGTNKVNVGHNYLLEGSVKVWVNNNLQKEDADYTVNYFEGNVTFTEIKNQTDYIEIIYEFTNPVEDFIPVLSRKNFLGAQYKWHSKPSIKTTKLKQKTSKRFKYAQPQEPENSLEETHYYSELDTKKAEENSAFFLEHAPIVLGSEVVKLNSQYLKKNIDYSLKQSTGKLKLLDLKLSETDILYIDYEYYLTEKTSEDIIGKDSTGPYQLKNRHLLSESISVLLEGRKLTEGLDYYVDHKEGKLMFNFEVQYPRILAVDYISIKTEKTNTANIKESPFSFGVSYLNEYVKSDEEELLKQAPSENYILTRNSTIFFTKYNPIPSTEDIKLYINNQPASPEDYEVDLYTGKFEILKENATTINISYSYQKSFRSTFLFQGKTGLQDYINNTDFQLRDIPVKHNGIYYILLRHYDNQGQMNELKLSPGSEFSVDYGENGEELIFRFIKQDEYNPTSKLDFYPTNGDMMTLIYDYTPQTTPDQGDINQKMIGVSFSSKINDNWSIDTEVMGAENNFSKPRASESKTFQGTGIDNQAYILRSNIVEDSEYIYVDQIDGPPLLLTKDRDYFLHYSTGSLRFINFTPSKNHTIKADYDYYDSSGTVESGESTGLKFATKVGTSYKSDNLNFNAYYKDIDKDIVPLAPIKDKKGTKVLGGKLKWDINKYENVLFDYERRDESKQAKKDSDGNSYLHSDNFNSAAKLNILGIFDTEQEFRYNLQLQDPLSEDGNSPINNKTIEYNGNVSFGPSFFRNTLVKGLSQKTDDAADAITQADSLQYSAEIRGKSLPLIGDINIRPSYKSSSAKTEQNVSSENSSLSSSKRITKQIHSQITPAIKGLSTVFDYSQEEVYAQSDGTTSTTTKQQIVNQHYGVNYSPFRWIRASYQHNRKQNENPLEDQTGRLEINNNFSIRSFQPADLLSHIGFDEESILVAPLKKSSLTYSLSNSKTNEHSDKKKFENQSHRISYSNFEPIPGFCLKQISFEKREADSNNNISTRTTSRNSSSTFFTRQKAEININPKIDILSPLSYQLSFEEIQDERISNYESDSSTSNSTQYLNPSTLKSQVLSYNPGRLSLSLGPNLFFDLGTFNGNIKETIEKTINTEIKQTFSPDGTLVTSASPERRDELNKQAYNYAANYSPFNLFPLLGTYFTNLETRRYNLFESPFRITKSDGFSISSQLNPLSFLKIKGSSKFGNTSQYRSPSLNASISAVETARSENNAWLLSNYLGQHNDQHSLKLTFSPFKILSFNGGYNLLNRSEGNENFSTKNQTTSSTSNYVQKTLSSGLTCTPIPGLSMGYTYSLLDTNKNNGQINNGYRDNIDITYVPIKTENFSVTVKFNHTHTWGKTLNSLDQKISQQSGNGIQESQISETNNTESLGSLNMKIVIPLPNSPFMDRLEIVGEAYLKQIMDGQDQYKANPADQSSFDISGLVLKGTLYF